LRAGVIVTGTEVLSGLIGDANGPWLAEALRRRGVTLVHTLIVGDRPADLRAGLDFMSDLDLVITSGGLGPTADDLTAETVADWVGVPMELDAELDERVWAIVESLRARLGGERDAMRAGARKQAHVPRGAVVLEPAGTAPGFIVGASPPVVILPGPPRELQTMWRRAVEVSPLRELLASAGVLDRRILRFFGLPEPVIAATLLELDADALPLEITTCLRRGELELATVFSDAAVYEPFEAELRARHGDVLFSDDGRTIDEVVAALLAGLTVATAESCTGGLMAGRLTDLAGSSAYVLGGLIVYSNEAKVALAGVDPALIESVGAVSAEVASALAAGARSALGADVGIGITGIAGPGGGSEEKPVGTVCLCVSAPWGTEERVVRLPGSRRDVRDRTTTVAMHMLRGLLLRR
jgi:nicotinamide-nucleotide amidase